MELSIKEFDKVKTQKLGTLQLSRAKKQFIGQLALQAESNNNDMIAVAKTYLYFDKVDSMIDVYKRIDSISAEEILEVSNEILIPDNFTIVSIGK
jgi:predicted Zn-dependent peptidase